MAEFQTFSDFLASGLETSLTEVSVSGVTYRLRDAQPLHADYRHQDSAGHWWSPDYLVVVAAGQSNMVGAASGGEKALDPNVMTYNLATGTITASSYLGNGGRNNLYIPFANELSQSTGQPVLVIAAPVSGSRIDSWLLSKTGANWLALDAAVTQALALIGQDHVDSFLWHQGEGDYPLSTATYSALMTTLIGQVRGAAWAGDAMAVLVGELSREGVNAAQNQALQALELAMAGDPLLRFVSSTGLNSADADGVHFDGPSLVAFGHRFFQALTDILQGNPVPADAAPVLALAPDAPSLVTVVEGQELRLSADLFFSDPDGDDLWLYGAVVKRQPHFLASENGDLVLRPGYEAAGTHQVQIYASDGQLDSLRHTITVTVLDAVPGASLTTFDFSRVLASHFTAELAMAAAAKSRGIDILEATALPVDRPLDVIWENMAIRGAAGVEADLVLAAPILKLTLAGAADFDVTGNALANYLVGNTGDNLLTGVQGNDRLFGNDGSDDLQGNAGADSLYGGDGDDILWGGVDADKLYGGGGADRLIGGAGKNSLYGGEDSDVFVFTPGEIQCLVQDFEVGQDRVEVSGRAGIVDFDSLMSVARLQSFATSATFGVRLTIEGEQLMLYRVTAADLSADMFLFS